MKQFCSVLLAGTILATSLTPMTVSAAAWRKNSVGWWYEEDNGSYPANQWKQINGNWYWFNKNGYMATGWQYIGGDWYYFQTSGAMIGQGWHAINGNWFYMYASGAMAADTWIGDSYVNSSGAWVQGKTKVQEGWVQSGSRWWYRHSDGGYTRNGWEMIKGQWYFFDKDGWMVTGWRQIGGDWYYFQTSGAMVGEGWHAINGNWYYMYANGVMATNTWINGDYVNSSGAWISNKNLAYGQKVKEYENKYGVAQIEESYYGSPPHMTGLCFIKLVDFAHNGQEQLLMVYRNSSGDYRYEVWDWNNQLSRLDYGEPISIDAGMYLVCLTEYGGKTYLLTGIVDDINQFDYYGFNGNTFGLVRRETVRKDYSSGYNVYYTCKINGKTVSKSTYDSEQKKWLKNLTEYNLSIDRDQIIKDNRAVKAKLGL